MLITKFNKLIRNKILWAFFAGVIAFFFVGASVMSRGGCGRDPNTRISEGRLFGEDVSANEFHLARYFELGMRPMSDTSDEALAVLRERTWRRLAALAMARRIGISVTDDDVRAVITSEPSFASNGTFDQARYLGFLQSQLRVDPSTFEDYIRQDLIMQRLRSALRTASWTTPYETKPRLIKLTDAVSLEYALIPEQLPTNDVTITEHEIDAYFKEHQAEFRIDEQRNVRYVRFPIADELDSVTVSEEDIQNYYDINIDAYTSFDTNRTETVQPLEAVSNAIAETLRQQKAQFEAKDEATRFVMALAPDRYGQAYDMQAAAKARGLTIATSEWFTASQSIPGLEDAGLDLTAAAFELIPNDPERYFSDAVVGSNAVYVIADLDSRPARDPELEEVRDQVVAATTIKLAEEALHQSVEDIRQRLSAASDAATNGFMSAAADLGLMTATTGVFTVYEGLPEEVPSGMELLSAIIGAKEGEVLEGMHTTDGILIAHIASRTHGDPLALEMLRPQFLRTMDQYQASAVYQQWLDYVMTEADFKDFHPIVSE